MDTRYLTRLHSLLDQELLRCERRDWAHQEFEHLENTRWAPSKREILGYRRLITGDNPEPHYVQCVRQLFEFRAQEAERCDLPVFRIFTDDVLSELASFSMVENLPSLDSSLALLAEPYRRRVKDMILSAKRTSLLDCPPPVDDYLDKEPPYDSKCFRKLQLARDRIAVKLKIDPSVIAGNKTLKRVAALSSDQRRSYLVAREFTGMRAWQWDLVTGSLINEGTSE